MGTQMLSIKCIIIFFMIRALLSTSFQIDIIPIKTFSIVYENNISSTTIPLYIYK